MSELDPSKHYKTPKNLTKRADFNARYSTFSWFGWLADQISAPSGTVLDIGCGPGWFWHSLGDRWQPETLILADQSEAMVLAAEKRLATTYSVQTQVADVAALPFATDSMDTVFAMHMLYHCPNPNAGLREIARVLKPQGQAIITTICDDDLSVIADLSRTTFGSSGTDLLLPVFGANRAAELLPLHFAAIDERRAIDRFRVDASDAALDYITSFPPGNSASEADRATFHKRFEALRIAQGGTVEMDRKQALFICQNAQ